MFHPVRVSALLVLASSMSGCSAGGGSGGGGGASGPAPTLTDVDPAHGPTTGGALVTLLGSGFLGEGAGTNVVRFGGAAALNVVVIDAETIECVTPAGAAGPADVVIQNGRGTASLPGGFAYVEAVDCDFDGDGIADLAVGAPEHDGTLADEGAVYVFFGAGLPTMVDANAAQADVRILGSGLGARFGASTTAADLNADGALDLIVGAPGKSAGSGAVYVYFGPLGAAGTLSASQADVVLTAEQVTADDAFGTAVASADVTGDEIADLIVSAPKHDHSTVDSGSVYVFHGGAGFASATAVAAEVELSGSAAGDRIGSSLATGDVNGDGIADVVVGAVYPVSSSGVVYVFFGGADLVTESAAGASWRITGANLADSFGYAVAAADLDADGIDDVIASAPRSDFATSNGGVVYVLFGGGPYANVLAGTADVIVPGDAAGDELGSSLAVGDVNGDGIPDLAAGAWKVNAGAVNNGRVYVFLGRAGFDVTGAGTAESIYTGLAITDELFGQVVQIVDVNGDGYGDVCGSAIEHGAGDLHVFFGGPVQLDGSAAADDVTFSGAAGGDAFGTSTARGH